jgi:hypothetical protein
VTVRTSASIAPATATLDTRRDGDTLVVQLSGQWHLRTGLAGAGESGLARRGHSTPHTEDDS